MDIKEYIDKKLTHSLHNSEVLSFRGCRRRHHWLFVDGWYPQTTAKPLEFGSAFHKALESWYEPEMWNKDPETRLTLAILEFIQTCGTQKAEYLKLNEGNIDPEVDKDYHERVQLGTGMLKYHCEKISPKLDVGFKPIRVEIEFEVPVVNPDTKEQLWCKCNNCWKRFAKSDEGLAKQLIPYKPVEGKPGYVRPVLNDSEYRQDYWEGLPVSFGGRIDMLAEDELGRLWLFDWKTAARLSGQEEGDSPDEFILLDDQISSYCWALWSLGIPIAGFVHHEIKKAFPIEPEPNKMQRMGAWYSVNKQQATSYELYLETVSEGDPQGLASGAYDNFLEYLKESGPRYYSRKQVVRSETELENVGRNIYLQALDIVDPNLRVYPSPGRFACSFCAFRQPCLGTNRNEDVEYLLLSNFERRETRYWEKALPSTEGKGGQ